jgi:hypothetical protein
MNSIQILVDSANGVYVPQVFVERAFPNGMAEGSEWKGVSDYDIQTVLRGPVIAREDDDNGVVEVNDGYWDAWTAILDNAYRELSGIRWTLHQDGDLFAVALDIMSDAEYENLFGELRPE